MVFHNTMRNKQVELNPYIFTLLKLSRYPVLIRNRAVFGTATGSYFTGTISRKNECQKNFVFTILVAFYNH